MDLLDLTDSIATNSVTQQVVTRCYSSSGLLSYPKYLVRSIVGIRSHKLLFAFANFPNITQDCLPMPLQEILSEDCLVSEFD